LLVDSGHGRHPRCRLKEPIPFNDANFERACSSEDLVEAIAMATARSLLGEQPGERLKCWYHNGEDNAQEIDRRIAAICQH